MSSFINEMQSVGIAAIGLPKTTKQNTNRKFISRFMCKSLERYIKMPESLIITPVTCRVPLFDKEGRPILKDGAVQTCGRQFQMEPPKIGDSIEKRQADFIGNILMKHMMKHHSQIASQIVLAGSMYAGYLTCGQLQFNNPDLLKRFQETRAQILRSCMPLTISDEMIQKRLEALENSYHMVDFDAVAEFVREVRDVLMGERNPPEVQTVPNGSKTPA